MPKGAYISQVAQRIIDNLLPCIDDRRVEHRVLVQGRLGALHKADLEPIISSLMAARVESAPPSFVGRQARSGGPKGATVDLV